MRVRVTSRMLNRMSRKSVGTTRRSSLLNRVNKMMGKTSNLQRTSQARATRTERLKYEKQMNTADELGMQIQKFTKSGEKNLFEKYKDAEDKSGLYKETESLVDKYNSFLTALSDGSDSLNTYYEMTFKNLVRSNEESLAEVGITVLKNGKLQIDKVKLQSAPPEKLEKVFGGKNDFLSRMDYYADRVSDRAAANVRSISGNYSQSGSMNYFSPSRYDFWG